MQMAGRAKGRLHQKRYKRKTKNKRTNGHKLLLLLLEITYFALTKSLNRQLVYRLLAR